MPESFDRLTPREREILEILAEGNGNKEIAADKQSYQSRAAGSQWHRGTS